MTTPARPAQPPSKEQRIAHLFLTGYGLDGICERGVAGGWTRRDAELVAEEQGWTLDSSGRIPRAEREKFTDEVERARAARDSALTIPPPSLQPPALALPGWAATLVEARKHEALRIKRAAQRVDDLLAKLGEELAAAEEEAKTRARLVELEAEREQLRAKLRKTPAKPTGDPAQAAAAPGEGPSSLKPIDHGTWGGFLQHKKRNVPLCDNCRGLSPRRPNRQAS